MIPLVLVDTAKLSIASHAPPEQRSTATRTRRSKTPDLEAGFFSIGFLRCIQLVALRYEPNAINNVIGYPKFYSGSHDAVISVYYDAGNLIGTHEHKGDFSEW